MFKWLRDKMLSGSEDEFNKCIDMCHAFIKFAQEQEMQNPSPIDVGTKFGYPDLSAKYFDIDYEEDFLQAQKLYEKKVREED